MTTPVVSPEFAQNELIQPKLPPLPKTFESPGNKMVFAGGKTDATRSLESVSDPIRAELPTLRELQKLNPTREREQQIFNLERKKKRSMSFALIQTRGTEEQKKIIEKRGSLEELRASDALFLKKKWVDLANLFLVTDTNPTGSVLRDTIKEKDSFVVNFWENKNINAVIGAGDILPPTVSHVRINGVEGERKYHPRPGYYDAKGKYLPIFDGDKLEVVKMGEVDEKTLNEARDSDDIWLRERRIEDMIDTDGKAITDLPEDKKLEEDAQKEIEEMKKRREKYKNYNPENKKKFLEMFGEIIDRETGKYGIPKDLLVNNLFEKENRTFDPEIKNPYSSAHGFGQIIDSTWKSIGRRLWTRLDRHNPEDQIVASCEYLNYIKNLRECSWWEAIVYYHTGEGFGDSNVQTAMEKNTPIVRYMTNQENPTAKDYVTAAAKYYGVTEYMSA